MLLLKRIQLRNFLSHSNTEIEFEPNDRLLIDGISGSGKSSIVDAIVWVLYGKARSDNRALIKKGTKSASVTLFFNIDKKQYRIERSITSAGKHDLDISEYGKKQFVPVKITGKKNIQEHLEKNILHSSYLLFINSIVYPQDNSDSFIKQTAAKRKEIILEIIRAADYDEYYNKTKERIDSTREKILIIDTKYQEKINYINILKDSECLKIVNRDKLISEMTTKTERLSEIDKELEKYPDIKIKYDKLFSSLISKEEEIKQKEKLLSDTGKRIEVLESQRVNLSDFENHKITATNKVNQLLEYKKEKLEFLKGVELGLEWENKRLKLLNQLPVKRDFEAEIKEINRQIIVVMNEETLECPDLGRRCPLFERKQQERINTLNDALVLKNSEFEAYKIICDGIKKKVEELGPAPAVDHLRGKEIDNKILSLENAEKELLEIEKLEINIKNNEKLIEDYIEQKEALNLEIIKAKEDLTKISQEMNPVGNSLVHLDDLSKQRQELEINLVGLKKTVEQINQVEKEIGAQQTELNGMEITKNNLEQEEECLELLKKAFGNNGIKSILIDYVIPDLENRINNILSKFSDFKVRLDTQKPGVGEETVLEGLFISIINAEGEEFDFNSYSGGEKMRITLAISEGLAELQKINFRILDEAITGLDQNTVEGFVQVLTSMRERFNQMVCISHLQQVKDEFDKKIKIIKINGESKIT